MENNFEHTSATTREFTLEFLEQITDKFSEEHIIGRGGYGVVYKVYPYDYYLDRSSEIVKITSLDLSSEIFY